MRRGSQTLSKFFFHQRRPAPEGLEINRNEGRFHVVYQPGQTLYLSFITPFPSYHSTCYLPTVKSLYLNWISRLPWAWSDSPNTDIGKFEPATQTNQILMLKFYLFFVHGICKEKYKRSVKFSVGEKHPEIFLSKKSTVLKLNSHLVFRMFEVKLRVERKEFEKME